jgi:hypothetical protein
LIFCRKGSRPENRAAFRSLNFILNKLFDPIVVFHIQEAKIPKESLGKIMPVTRFDFHEKLGIVFFNAIFTK